MAKKPIEKEYGVKPDQLYALAMDAIMKLGYTVTQQSKLDGFINFKTGITWTSFSGLEVGVIITDTAANGSRISFGGGTAANAGNRSGQLVVFGGAKGPAKKVTAIIDGRIKKGAVPPHKPSNQGGAAFSVADEIKKLAELLSQGILTQAEFDAKKKQLLGLDT
jgi:hypothetical protein